MDVRMNGAGNRCVGRVAVVVLTRSRGPPVTRALVFQAQRESWLVGIPSLQHGGER